MNDDDFKVTKGFKSYVSKPEITDLAPNFLVRGSKNVINDYASRVVSRLGYTLFGAANTGGAGFKSSYEWHSSTSKEFPLRAGDGKLQFYWNSTWNTLVSGMATSFLEFAKVWDNTEKIDVLLWVLGDGNRYKWSGGVAKIRVSTGTTVTKQGVLIGTTYAFVAGTTGTVAPTITDSANGFVTAGFVAGDTLYVSGSVSNNRNFTIGSVTAGTITLVMSDVLVTEAAGATVTMHNGEPTWASSRFFTTSTRKIVYNGVEYAYTGGETTDTLTGLVAFPSATAGDPTWQAPITTANDAADIPVSFKPDLIGVTQNQVVLASTKSAEIYGSSTINYNDFHLTSPRAPGDPFKVVMDDYCTCIVSADNPAQNDSSLIFGGGTSEFFKFDYKISQDLTNEIVRMIKLKTATSSGVISKGAITPIKKAVAFISREPSLDTISNLESQDASDVPISDLIQDDFNAYDFTNAHIRYWKRAIYLALPAEGVVLIFDLMRKLWQPPQYMPIARLAIIDDWLYGHSSVTNETYRLFTGTDDNGAYIPQIARFAYNNSGRRDRIKNMSEYWTDGYISPGGVLAMNMNLGFEGSVEKKVMMISGNDSEIVTPLGGSTLGDEPLGTTPIGGALLGAVIGIAGSGGTLLRFQQEDTMSLADYFESFVEYTMNSLNGQFAIVAHGSNAWDAGTSPVTHKK